MDACVSAYVSDRGVATGVYGYLYPKISPSKRFMGYK